MRSLGNDSDWLALAVVAQRSSSAEDPLRTPTRGVGPPVMVPQWPFPIRRGSSAGSAHLRDRAASGPFSGWAGSPEESRAEGGRVLAQLGWFVDGEFFAEQSYP